MSHDGNAERCRGDVTELLDCDVSGSNVGRFQGGNPAMLHPRSVSIGHALPRSRQRIFHGPMELTIANKRVGLLNLFCYKTCFHFQESQW